MIAKLFCSTGKGSLSNFILKFCIHEVLCYARKQYTMVNFRSIYPLWFPKNNIISALDIFLTIAYQVFRDEETYYENHHHEKKLLSWKHLKLCVCSSTIFSCYAFNSAFVANVTSFAFKSESFTRYTLLCFFH